MRFTLALICLFAIASTHAFSTYHESQLHPIYKRGMTTSEKCSNNGYSYNDICYCLENYSGEKCNEYGFLGWDNTDDKCDDLTNRLDHLFNESPEYGHVDDNLFPRLTGDSIGKGKAAYGEKGNTWIKMHAINKDFTIFNEDKIHPADVGQGALGNCYLLAALASLANIRGGEPIKQIFQTKEDNEQHVYVARWLIDGKVRMVSTDEWVPGSGSRPSFSKETRTGQMWSIIIEKQWAKIHGEFMVTEGGWQTNVWKAMTAAPIGAMRHSSSNANALFETLEKFFKNEWGVGSATLYNTKKDLVQGHAYAVLNTYTITSEGQQVKLVKAFNPWASEQQYKNKEWAEGSAKWTAAVIAQVPEYEKKNDGMFYMTHQEYFDQFGITNWVEVQQGYEQTYQEIKLTTNKVYTTKFTNKKSDLLYVSVESVDRRLYKGCQAPFRVGTVRVKCLKSNKVYTASQEGWESVKTAKIEAPHVNGEYEVSVSISSIKNYHKFFAVHTYNAVGAVEFADQQDEYVETYTKSCPSDCSRHGICNTFSGSCKCDFGYESSDCSVKSKAVCKGGCGDHGKCVEGNVCECESGFVGANCVACTDKKGGSCAGWKKAGYCAATHQYFGYMSSNCQKTCEIGGCAAKEEKQEQSCKNNCNDNGQCVNMVCQCNKGFEGEDCGRKTQPKCQDNCSGNGKCMDGNVCKCNKGFSGSNCATQEQTKPKCPSDCNRRGKCNSDNTCSCNSGFSGEACQTEEKKKEEEESDCSDVSKSCNVFNQFGMCSDKSVAGYVLKYCQKTCKQCGQDKQEENDNCKDMDKYKRNCAGWKNAGYCAKDHKYHNYLKNYCPKTCGLC